MTGLEENIGILKNLQQRSFLLFISITKYGGEYSLAYWRKKNTLVCQLASENGQKEDTKSKMFQWHSKRKLISEKYLKYHFPRSQIVSWPFTGIFVSGSDCLAESFKVNETFQGTESYSPNFPAAVPKTFRHWRCFVSLKARKYRIKFDLRDLNQYK